ncbi:MAG: hypothetical protein CMH49_09850 [Myxococcales bacterium]|nr:hypothetical protein [Myxococcales bacterium]
MTETHHLVSGADPEVALYDGIAFYESGEIYNALSCWKELLKLVPEHEIAQRYIEFVQGYLGLSDQFTESEVSGAQRREGNKLRGQEGSAEPTNDGFDPNMLQAPSGAVAQVITPQASPEAPPPPESIRIRRGASALSTQKGMGFASEAEESAEDLIEEEVVTKQPNEILPATLLATPTEQLADSVAQMARSAQAQKAITGEVGPRTQADGLTIQALSRQLADYHRSGKYEQAVDTAKKLLLQDPQHAVARRYIDEYHRQKQAALQAAKRKQKVSQDTDPAQDGTTPIEAAADAKSNHAFSTQLGSPSNQVMGNPEDAPTAAPANQPLTNEMSVSEGPVISDLTYKPKVKMKSDQISWQAFDHRAGFFMSQVDGSTTYEDLIVISAMPRAQALNILEQLVSNGVIG